jgi:HK97 family phage major capsid protein
VITGIATSAETDRMGDIVEPKGAEFKLPIPLLWQHNADEPIGEVFAAKVTSYGIEIKARIAQVSEPGRLRDRLDEAWQSLTSSPPLVRGLSIGFQPIEHAKIDGTYGLRFIKWLWLELSAVTIPAHQNATILSVKAIDQPFLAASGEGQGRVASPSAGDSAQVSTRTRKGVHTMPKTYQEQKNDLNSTIQAKQAQLEGIQEKAASEGRGKDASERESFDSLMGEVEQLKAELVDVDKMEQISKSSAKPVAASTQAEASASRNQATNVVTVKSNLPPGMEFTRFVICKAAAYLSQGGQSATEIAKERYPDQPRIQTLLKAAVGGGTTLDSNYALALAYAQDLPGEFLEYLRPQTIIGRIPNLTRVPFNVRYASQTTGGSASWVGQGKPKPLTNFTFASSTLGITKLAAIAVLADELVRTSSPNAEALVRASLTGAVVQQQDLDFVDPANAGTSNVKPASITNGVTPIASAGTSSDNATTDVGKLFKVYLEAKLDPSQTVFLMPPSLAMSLGLMKNSLGQRVFDGISAAGGTLEGIPVVTSQSLAFTSNYGNIVIALHAPSIFLADDGQVTIDVSREASLEMLDGSLTQDGSAGTGASLVSMFQTNMLAIRAERFINWKKARTNAVQWMSDVNWGSLGSPA